MKQFFILTLLVLFSGVICAEGNANQKLTLFSSPAEDLVRLANLDKEVCKIQVEDPLGVVLFTAGVERSAPKFDVASLGEGVYVIKCYNVFDELKQTAAYIKEVKIDTYISAR